MVPGRGHLTVSRIVLAVFIGCMFPPVCEAQVGDAFDLLNSITIDGGYNLGDEARGVSVDSSGNIFLAGYITVPGQGRDIFLARYNEDLVEQDSVTVNGRCQVAMTRVMSMAFDGAGYSVSRRLYDRGRRGSQRMDRKIRL